MFISVMCGVDTHEIPGKFYVNKNQPIPLSGCVPGVQVKNSFPKDFLPKKWSGGAILEKGEIVDFPMVSFVGWN